MTLLPALLIFAASILACLSALAACGLVAISVGREQAQQFDSFKANRFIVPKYYGLYKHILGKHFRGEVAGRVFVYCPGRAGDEPIVSWHPKDYENYYCPNHKSFFGKSQS